MTKKLIRDAAKLPSWFDLNKYDTSSQLTPIEWAKQLDRRQEIKWLLSRDSESDHVQAWELFEEIKTMPIIPNRSQSPSATRITSYVQPIKCGYIQATSKDIAEFYGVSEDNDLVSISSTEVSQFLNESNSYLSSQAPVLIDLTGSDVDIESDFRSYLKQVRKHSGFQTHKTHITPAVYKKLNDYKVLPYLDLKIWELQSGQSITNVALMNALYRNHNDELFLHKTIIPFVKNINATFIRALESYHTH